MCAETGKLENISNKQLANTHMESSIRHISKYDPGSGRSTSAGSAKASFLLQLLLSTVEPYWTWMLPIVFAMSRPAELEFVYVSNGASNAYSGLSDDIMS